MKALTEPQNRLFNKLIPVFIEHSAKQPPTFDYLKKVTNEKSFDSTFNALCAKGYIIPYPTNDYSNRFILHKQY